MFFGYTMTILCYKSATDWYANAKDYSDVATAILFGTFSFVSFVMTVTIALYVIETTIHRFPFSDALGKSLADDCDFNNKDTRTRARA